MALSDVALVLAGIAFAALVLYLLYGLASRAFREVGFTPHEAALILLGSFVGAAFDVPLGHVNGWPVAVNVGGALVPLFVVFLLLRRKPGIWKEALAGTTVIAAVAYATTRVEPDGIASPFPLWLLPSVAAALMSVVAFWRHEDHAAPLAYVAGTLGALIGGDLLHFPDFVAQTPPASGQGAASIGGAAVFDMIYLTGILAAGMDALLFRQRSRETLKHRMPFEEPLVFTPGTPPDIMQAYNPGREIAQRAAAAKATQTARKEPGRR